MFEVSVIVPIYNAEKSLEKCINSILNQSFKNIEVILVNDGSTDKSLKICMKYSSKDKRINVINKQNEGCIATRRVGINIAKAKYIMFVDADDWINKRTIEVLHKEITENEVDIIISNMYKAIGNGLIKKQNNSNYFIEDKIYNKLKIKRDLVTAYFHGHPFPSSLCAKLYKKELLINSGKYLKRIHFSGEDLYYNLEIFLKANRVKVISKPLYYYRIGGFTSKYMPYLFDDMISGYQIQKEVIDEYYRETFQKQRNGISIMLLNTFKTCLQNLFNNNFTQVEIKEIIRKYVSNENIIEALQNEGSIKYFPADFLDAIFEKDLEYLFDYGKKIHKSYWPRKFLIKIMTKMSML